MADNVIRIPQPVEPPKIQMQQPMQDESLEKELPTQRKKSKMSDLFSVPQADDNDIYTDDLVDLDMEDVYGGSSDLSDLTTVSTEDIMGRPTKSRATKRYRRTARNYPQPPSMGGVNY